MIKANELRLGNLLNYQTAEGDIVVIEVNLPQMQWIINDEKGFNLVHSPIPLTEDWLVKFGFENYIDFGKKTSMFYLIPLCGISYNIATKKLMIFEKGNAISHIIERKIKYVHKLQNLVFALRKMELETKGGNND